jgi:hypothetical protein
MVEAGRIELPSKTAFPALPRASSLYLSRCGSLSRTPDPSSSPILFSWVCYEQKLALAIQIWLHEVQFLLDQNWLMRGYLGCECKVIVCSYFLSRFLCGQRESTARNEELTRFCRTLTPPRYIHYDAKLNLIVQKRKLKSNNCRSSSGKHKLYGG